MRGFLTLGIARQRRKRGLDPEPPADQGKDITEGGVVLVYWKPGKAGNQEY
jgi:hypothetical protein